MPGQSEFTQLMRTASSGSQPRFAGYKARKAQTEIAMAISGLPAKAALSIAPCRPIAAVIRQSIHVRATLRQRPATIFFSIGPAIFYARDRQPSGGWFCAWQAASVSSHSATG